MIFILFEEMADYLTPVDLFCRKIFEVLSNNFDKNINLYMKIHLLRSLTTFKRSPS